MTEFASLLAGGESGDKAIVPGKPDKSYLVTLITSSGDEAEMPRGKTPLSARQITLIKQWIAEGAIDDTPESARRKFDAEHPPTDSQSPADGWAWRARFRLGTWKPVSSARRTRLLSMRFTA